MHVRFIAITVLSVKNYSDFIRNNVMMVLNIEMCESVVGLTKQSL